MNWGTKVVLGMITFMLFIVCMVVYMFRVHGRDALVEENYYEKGINYNVEFNAKQNVINEHAQPVINITKNQIIIELKTAAKYELVMMRPSNSLEDVKLQGNTSGTANLILVDRTKMGKGMWFFNLQWKAGNKDYMFKKNITL